MNDDSIIGGLVGNTNKDISRRLYLKMFGEEPKSSTDGFDSQTREILTNTPVKLQELPRNTDGILIVDKNDEPNLLNVELVDSKYKLESFNNVVDREFEEFLPPVVEVDEEDEEDTQEIIDDLENEQENLQLENEGLQDQIDLLTNQITELNATYEQSLADITNRLTGKDCEKPKTAEQKKEEQEQRVIQTAIKTGDLKTIRTARKTERKDLRQQKKTGEITGKEFRAAKKKNRKQKRAAIKEAKTNAVATGIGKLFGKKKKRKKRK